MRGSSFGYLIKEGAKNIYANRLMSFASIGTLVACMLLIGSALLFSINVNSFVGYIEEQNEVVALISDDATEQEVEDISNQLTLIDNILDFTYVSKEQAIEEQMALYGESAFLLEDFEGENNPENPLPNSFRLRIKDLSILSSTIMKLEAVEGIESVKAPTEVAEILSSIKRAVYSGGMFIVLILMAVSLVIIANPIKITVFNRRKEINIMKYVGATDGFIRLPFIVEGFLLGIISAVLAFGVLWVGYNYVLQVLAENPSAWINQIYQNTIPFQKVALQMAAWFGGGGIGIGVFGSMFFVNKYLKV